MNNNVKRLIADIAQQCHKHGISFRLENKSLLDADGLPCSGYFDESSLVVATKKPKLNDWLDVLIHESCHLDQWAKKAKVWIPDDIGLFVVEKWTKGKNINKKKVFEAFKNTILLELDCEKRTVKKAKKYKIKLNFETYIQKANSYLFSYVYTLENKKWYATPYEKAHIYKKMPKKFLSLNQYFEDYNKYSNLYK
jgi:hypothetical protein